MHVGQPMLPPPVAKRIFPHEYPSVEKIDRVARKTVASYSPMRSDPIIDRRVAWGGPHDAASYVEMKKQYSFGREGHSADEWARE